MSILIKGMEMSKDIEPGLVIEFADGIDGKRYARLWHYRHGGLTEWLETVPVLTPHGRLIDADALIKAIAENMEAAKKADNYDWWNSCSVAGDFVMDAPTIIPAEEGE